MTPPTADATEALARVLRESAEPFGKVDWMEFARRAAAKGVTLSAPAVAPDKLTPVQEAALAVNRECPPMSLEQCERIARAVLAAAVGALEPVKMDTVLDEADGGDMWRHEKFRAALLAALTEGGEG